MSSNLRKEKEREFYMQHMDAFKAIGIADPFFTIKTAFFKKGKFGRQCQFFEWELKKGEDIYMEFYDNAYDGNGKTIDIIPMNEDRSLFKLKYNPYFQEEYDVIEGVDSEGKPDRKYLIPVNEMMVVLSSGQEISHALYEKRKEDAKNDLPELQKSLSLFPDFEKEYSPKVEEVFLNDEDESVSDILMKISVEFQKLAKKL
jgi:hypothetical protein|tara:strand:- start:360 stop:962 length:603 start_codon:yes stop_codon:yes gene_type:complete